METPTPFQRLSLWRKMVMIALFPILLVVMASLLVIGFVGMNIRNIGRWLDVFGAKIIGSYSLYKDLWPLTVGGLLSWYRELFTGG